MYHLIAKDKVVEQYILEKYSNLSKNFKVAIAQPYNVKQV